MAPQHYPYQHNSFPLSIVMLAKNGHATIKGMNAAVLVLATQQSSINYSQISLEWSCDSFFAFCTALLDQ